MWHTILLGWLGAHLLDELFGAPRPLRVLVLGDSITAANPGYVDALQAALPASAAVTRAGFVGKGAAYLRERLPALLEQTSPTHVVVLAGVNDLASGRSLAAIREALAGIYLKVTAAGATPVAVEVLPWATYANGRKFDLRAWRALNQWITTAAPAGAVVPTARLGDAEGRLPPRLTTDGLHLSRAGHAALAQLIHHHAFGGL